MQGPCGRRARAAPESHGEQRHHPIERLARAAQGDERAIEVVHRGGSTVAVGAAHLRESE